MGVPQDGTSAGFQPAREASETPALLVSWLYEGCDCLCTWHANAMNASSCGRDENTRTERYNPTISSYVGCGIPGFQVGSRSSSILPLGSRKYSSRPGKKPCSRYTMGWTMRMPCAWKSLQPSSNISGLTSKE